MKFRTLTKPAAATLTAFLITLAPLASQAGPLEEEAFATSVGSTRMVGASQQSPSSEPPTDETGSELGGQPGLDGQGEPDGELGPEEGPGLGDELDLGEGDLLGGTEVDEDAGLDAGEDTTGVEVDPVLDDEEEILSSAAGSPTIRRLSGVDRYATSDAVGGSLGRVNQPVFVASGRQFPDALAVGPAVGRLGGTLFLTPAGQIRTSTLSKIRALAPPAIYIVGGEGAVPAAVEGNLASIAPTERIGGADRYETSRMIVERFFPEAQERIFLATGADYPDALTSSAVAGALGAPVLLVRGKNQTDSAAASVVATKGVGQVVLAGGTGAVSAGIEKQMRGLAGGPSVQRLGGADRYLTNKAANDFLDRTLGTAPEGIWLATGSNFPDALSAAVPAGEASQRLVLSRASCLPTRVVIDWIEAGQKEGGLPVSRVTLVGGTGVLSSNVAKLQRCDPRPGGPGWVHDPVPAEGYLSLPASSGMIGIHINTAGRSLPSLKSDGTLPVLVTLVSGSKEVNAYGTIRVQGTSTAWWPKKNWSLKLFSNATRTKGIPLKVGDSVPSTEWIAKAEWIDPSQMRNQLSYRLWEDMTLSRSGKPMREVENSNATHNLGAVGYPRTHMSRVVINGKHYGLSTLTLGHDPKNFNIDRANSNHFYFEFDARFGRSLTREWDKFAGWGVDQHFENYLTSNGKFTSAQVQKIDRLGKLFNGTQANFKNRFNDYLDRQNMIDMLLFIEVLYDWDGMAQDLEFVSYDGQKWYILPWDKDTTFGMYWDGSGIQAGSERKLAVNYKKEDVTQKPWYKTYHSFKPQVEARYAQLRREGVFTSANLNSHIAELNAAVPASVWTAERQRWASSGRLSSAGADSKQISSWFGKRLTFLDSHFNYKP